MLFSCKSSHNLINPPGRAKGDGDKGRGVDCSRLVLDGVKGRSAGGGGLCGVPLQRVVEVGGDEPHHPAVATRKASCGREETMGELGQGRKAAHFPWQTSCVPPQSDLFYLFLLSWATMSGAPCSQRVPNKVLCVQRCYPADPVAV